MRLEATRRPTVILAVLAILLLAAVPISLLVGVYPVRWPTVGRIAVHLVWPSSDPPSPAWTQTDLIVVAVIRLPRVLLATLAGMGLGLAGATLQGLFRNPLVGPDIVGISAGAAFGAVLGMALLVPITLTVAMAFAGGLLALVAAAGIAARARDPGILSVVLAGVIVSAFFSALVGLAQYLVRPETQLPGIVYWLMGSFAAADPSRVLILAVPVLVAGTALIGLGWRINLLSLDDDDARALGVPVSRLRWTMIALVAVIVAAQVSVSGTIGWIGLVIPHLARLLVGPDHRRLLPASAFLGGGFALLADDLARSVTDQELPVGLLSALVGTPVFAVLFWRVQQRGWRHG